MDVVVYDPFVGDELLATLDLKRAELDDIFRTADLISIHAPLTAETRHLVDARRLALIKPTAILVNTSRGPLIDEAALAETLAAGRIGGVGLDVFEIEPLPPSSPLRTFDNVLLSPHVSGMDRMAEQLVTARCVRSILDFLGGRPELIKPYVINPHVLTGLVAR
jgi:phosphoglycerate dehydrogenase-like enzyme